MTTTYVEHLPANANGRKRWSRTELEFMEGACLLKGRYELLDGEIIVKGAYSSELPPTPNGRRRWTRTEVEFLENVGLLKGKYELIDGEIIDKMVQNSPHAITVMRIILYLARLFGDLRVRTQATVDIRDQDRVSNQPEPDVAVLLDVTLTGAPDSDNVLLAVEVSDTTQADDYGYKSGLYARAGVGEYWIVDLTRRVLVAYRRAENGEWQTRQEFAEDAQIAPVSAPDAFVSITDLLPPLAA